MAAKPRWTYVDEPRTHEVRFYQEPRRVRVVERTPGDEDPSGWLVEGFPAVDEWDARAMKVELEARLGMLGAYWRSEGEGWRRLPQRPRIVELEGLDVELEPGTHTLLHAFRRPGSAARWLLETPTGDVGRAAMRELQTRDDLGAVATRELHAGLTRGPLASLRAREHLRAHDAGFVKLTRAADLALVYGPDWRERLRGTLAAGTDGLPEEAPVEDSGPDRQSLLVMAEAVLGDVRLIRAERRFFDAQEQEDVLREGDLAIQTAVSRKRRVATHADQAILSVLEASLILRQRLRARATLEAGLVERVQRLAYYLPD